MRGDLAGIVDDEDDLGVPRATRAHLLVGRVRGDAARVADGGREHARCLPEDPLGAPEAAHADDEALEAVGKRRDERGAENDVPLGYGDRGVAPGERGVGRRELG